MSVQPIQCPKCGSPLQVESGLRQAWCSYCGSQLRITSGSSGHPLAVLDDLRADTSLLAKQRALEHLRQHRAVLLVEREKLCAECEQRKRYIDHVPSQREVGDRQGLIVLFSIWASLAVCMALYGTSIVPTGGSSGILVAVMGALFAGVLLVGARSAAKDKALLVKKVEEERESARSELAQCEARMRAIDGELDQVCLRIDGLQKEITRLSMEV